MLTWCCGDHDRAGGAGIPIPHGDIKVAFTRLMTKKVREGAKHFDVEEFGAQWATPTVIDGGGGGRTGFENWYASISKNAISVNVHHGTAKDWRWLKPRIVGGEDSRGSAGG